MTSLSDPSAPARPFDVHGGPERPQKTYPEVPAALALPLLALPPLACAGAAIAIRRRERMLANPSAVRARDAARRTREQMRDGDPADALANYVAAKVHRPDGTITRRELARCIADAGGSDALVAEVDAVAEAGERARFAPQSAADRDAVRGRADAALRQLESLKWRVAPKGGAE